MKYIDLIEKLSDTDKTILNTYIAKNGCVEEDFVGVDTWLQNWSHSNQKLYRILGNSFIREFPYSYKKTQEMLRKEIKELLMHSGLKDNYHNFYWLYIKKQDYLTDENKTFFNHLLDVENFIYERIDFPLKIKKPGAKKMLQIQAGTKPIKAIGRVLEYFKEEYDEHSFNKNNKNDLENFRKKYSIILSEKEVKGKFCLSIHPMDYLTMSDNASNWTSCMNWREGGCYHVGTIEMMNSNNVICAYLLNDNSSFVFDPKSLDPDTGEVYGLWNNKRWRQLFYITKDIVMSGKAYPYRSNELSLAILAKLKELAAENINWNYEFGPELYQDMIHVNSIWHMDNQRTWMRYEKKNPVKHNIIWDTKGMYNDMLNDSMTKYWCYRNKVHHTKIISTSGKANCLCCNNDILCYNYDTDDYNERYQNTGEVICNDCLDKNYTCSCCGQINTKYKPNTLKDGNLICRQCEKRIKICPCCGEIFYLNHGKEIHEFYYNNFLYEKLKNNEHLIHYKDRCYTIVTPLDYYEEYLNIIENKLNQIFSQEDGFMQNRVYLESFFCCMKCGEKLETIFCENDPMHIKFPRMWSKNDNDFLIVNPDIAEKYRVKNLQIPDIKSLSRSDIKRAI